MRWRPLSCVIVVVARIMDRLFCARLLATAQKATTRTIRKLDGKEFRTAVIQKTFSRLSVLLQWRDVSSTPCENYRPACGSPVDRLAHSGCYYALPGAATDWRNPGAA